MLKSRFLFYAFLLPCVAVLFSVFAEYFLYIRPCTLCVLQRNLYGVTTICAGGACLWGSQYNRAKDSLERIILCCIILIFVTSLYQVYSTSASDVSSFCTSGNSCSLLHADDEIFGTPVVQISFIYTTITCVTLMYLGYKSRRIEKDKNISV